MFRPLFLAVVLFGTGCTSTPEKKVNNKAEEKRADAHSFARADQALAKHLDLELKVDFQTKILTGKASWTIEHKEGDQIVFDTRDLNISKVTTGSDEKPANHTFGEGSDLHGKPLLIDIEPGTTIVNIYYTTSPDAAALQWLDPQQTAGKKHPFLFTQSQAILARTWIPIQDSPGIRITYNATVQVPKELLALMSAQNPQQKNNTGIYTFKQDKPIPSYLMALAVGDVQFKSVDNRSGVYAEPATLQKAAAEFADMGKMITAAEELYGPYKWGRYDVLVLPPSFPFGGMENPMLTFATPTILAGDKSLVSLIAHELAHSWSGNLVTNATWNDFWLNEGFTVYFERRIVEAVYGKEEAEMQEVLGNQDLKNTVNEMGFTNADTRLLVDFDKRDPDEGVSDIAYEKGYAFLKTIEDAVGRERFDEFLKTYFEKHAFQSMTTKRFLDYLDANLIKGDDSLKKKIDTYSWVYRPGIPKNIPAVGSSRFTAIDSILSAYKKSKNPSGYSSRIKSYTEKHYFLRNLPEKLTSAEMAALDKEFDFTNSGNAEIQATWYTLAIRNNYQPAASNTENFLMSVGRRKFLMPLYKEMAKTPEGKKRANQIYEKARPNYHSVSYNSIDEVLK